MVFYTGIMAGFCVPGYIATLWRLNIKQGFLWSFLLMGVSIAYLLHVPDIAHAYLAMFLWGAGQGIFWLTINTFELSETEDSERDFYSSVLSAGNQIWSLVGPALAALLIWLSASVFGLGPYTLLFTAAPIVFLLGIFCFSDIRDYRPGPIRWADVTHYFTDRRNQEAQVYTLGTGIQQTLGVTILPLATFFVLGTALRVGVYNTLFAVLSAICILIVARYRTPGNRLLIYGLTMLGMILATSWFGYALSFAGLILYTVADALLAPVMNVTSHVIDLSAMELGRAESDFYATMILRDFFLWVWRIAGGFIFLGIARVWGTGDAPALSAGLYLIAAALALTYFGAYLFMRLRAA
jgi:hypothetical protein